MEYTLQRYAIPLLREYLGDGLDSWEEGKFRPL